MGAFGQYAKINPVLIDFKDDEWLSLIEKKRSERDFYNTDGSTISYGQVAARFLGISGDEDEYYNKLFELSQNPKLQIHVLSGNLKKEIDNEQFQALQSILQINQNETLSVNRFVAFLEGRQLIPSYEDASVHRHLRESLIRVLNAFNDNHPTGFKSPEFRRVIVDLTKWLWNHIDSLLKEMKDDNMPTVVWYGDATKSEIYLLFLIKTIGMDLLLFHPQGNDVFSEIDPKQELTVVKLFPDKKEPRPFPVKRAVRKATVAYQASKEIERILHHEDSPVFKPWQYRSHKSAPITLKTTYDELFLTAREKAFIRPGFRIEQDVVYVPNLFAKISGVPENRKEYWERLEELRTGGDCLFIRYFPFTNGSQANHQYHYTHALGGDGKLDPQKMVKAVWWKHNQLPTGVQLALASAISRVCEYPKLIREEHESKYDLQLYIFTQLTSLPQSAVNLLMKFDYPQTVPRIVLYNSGTSGGIMRSDAVLLLLLNELGMDTFLFNPSGLRDLEMFIEERYYDIHLMDQFEFNYEYQEPKIPIWRRFFKKDK